MIRFFCKTRFHTCTNVGAALFETIVGTFLLQVHERIGSQDATCGHKCRDESDQANRGQPPSRTNGSAWFQVLPFVARCASNDFPVRKGPDVSIEKKTLGKSKEVLIVQNRTFNCKNGHLQLIAMSAGSAKRYITNRLLLDPNGRVRATYQ